MNKSRLEAFSDGVFAIIITIMILELKIPGGTAWKDIQPLLPKFICYLLSFVFIAIYWNNHHHLLHTVHKINGGMMWANMHLLFWLSLIPFATGWVGETNFDRIAVAVYGALLLVSGLSYTILSQTIRRTYKNETLLTRALAHDDRKGMASVILYAVSIPIALYVHPLLSTVLFGTVSVLWFIPSKAIEQAIEEER